MSCVIAIDAGTTGVRARAVYVDGRPSVAAYREFPAHFPQPGWVEHDPDDIWRAVVDTVTEVVAQVGAAAVQAIGLTNQRETAVAWDRRTGQAVARAIVWQDRRTAQRCSELRATGHEAEIRRRTGLVLDPYFSASKWEWMLHHGQVDAAAAGRGEIVFGTVDAWVLYKLTGGTVVATDVSNASRTMLCSIESRTWDQDLCELFGIPMAALPEIRPSSGRFGHTAPIDGLPGGIPISGVAGDQQAALFGQACWSPGMAKNTYGTGSFVLMNLGDSCPDPAEGLITTVGWELADGSVTYALEGSIFVTGAAVQWLRDGLGLITEASELAALAATVPDAGGVVLVPAFTGLGSPHWDPYARGVLIGLTRGTGPGQVARAVVDSIACQVDDVVRAMTAHTGTALEELRVDGGAAAMDLMLQLQADLTGVPVRRPTETETTAIGAALLAGLGEGVWPDLETLASQWHLEAEFFPAPDAQTEIIRRNWAAAVPRSRNWLSASE